jgi:hypothetical protein
MNVGSPEEVTRASGDRSYRWIFPGPAGASVGHFQEVGAKDSVR